MIESSFLGLISCWTAFTLAASVPGPNNIAVISVTLESGRRSGLFVALGIAVGAFFWALMTAYGLAKLFEYFPALIRVFALLGGGYLTWLGIKAIKSVFSNPNAISDFDSKYVKRAVMHGFTVTATNPKAALFWLSLSTMISSLSGSLAIMMLFALVTAVLAFLVYGSYALAFSISTFRHWYECKQKYFNFLFGGYFLSIGLLLIVVLGFN